MKGHTTTPQHLEKHGRYLGFGQFCEHSIKLLRTPPLCCYLRFLFANKGFPTLAAHVSVVWCLPQGKIQGIIKPGSASDHHWDPWSTYSSVNEAHRLGHSIPGCKRLMASIASWVLGVYLRHLFTGSSHTNIFKFPLQAFRVNQDSFFSPQMPSANLWLENVGVDARALGSPPDGCMVSLDDQRWSNPHCQGEKPYVERWCWLQTTSTTWENLELYNDLGNSSIVRQSCLQY